MKTVRLFAMTFISIMLLHACKKQDTLIKSPKDVSLEAQKKSDLGKADGYVELPFKAKFFTKRNYSDDGAGYCTESPFLSYNYQVGEGNATHLGHFTTTIHFCTSGFDYKNGEGVFIAANGDELYFKIPSEGVVGHILPYDDPFYEKQFQDPFTFTGGTGRFEGASGGGMTNSFVNLLDDNGVFIPEHQTDHTWSGEITLPKQP